MDTTLVTGAAGFVGAHVCRRLLLEGDRVVGLDNFSPYYDRQLKEDRLECLVRRLPEAAERFRFHRTDLRDADAVRDLVRVTRPTRIVHLAAQAGVRYGLEAPGEYLSSNVVGFDNLLEACRDGVREGWLKHLVYASSSSVYGNSAHLPFSEHEPADHPVSLYAATKRSDEILAHSYSDVFGIPTTGLRFFTVYGPWGRPDMAYWSFTEAILRGDPLPVYGDGSAVRDYTYVHDVVRAVTAVARMPVGSDAGWAEHDPDAASAAAPWRILNVGHGGGSTVEQMISLLERYLERPAQRLYIDGPPGDVRATSANVDDLVALVGFRPEVDLELGLRRFVSWYLRYAASRAGTLVGSRS
jgi:UDP-glucuronate 4-epimerase